MSDPFQSCGRRAAIALAGLLVGATVAAQAAQVEPSAHTAPAGQLIDEYVESIRTLLTLPDDLPIEPALRHALDRMTAEQMPRIAEVVRGWASATDTGSTVAVSENNLRRRLSARLVNEMALWHLESPGAAYDAALLPAVLDPGSCLATLDRYGWARQAVLLQRVAASERQIVLDGERKLLQRWGSPRDRLPARPSPSLADQENALIARARAGEPVPMPAMPPVLAHMLLVDDPSDMDPNVGCALHRWGLAHALAAANADRSERLLAYRYEILPLSHPWLGSSNAVAQSDGYPQLAKSFRAQGAVMLKITLDANARFKRAVVAARDITIDGVSDRPVAFEWMFDEASLARAASSAYTLPAGATVKDGEFTATQVIHWNLE
jgi:hypothetical protein